MKDDNVSLVALSEHEKQVAMSNSSELYDALESVVGNLARKNVAIARMFSNVLTKILTEEELVQKLNSVSILLGLKSKAAGGILEDYNLLRSSYWDVIYSKSPNQEVLIKKEVLPTGINYSLELKRNDIPVDTEAKEKHVEDIVVFNVFCMPKEGRGLHVVSDVSLKYVSDGLVEPLFSTATDVSY